MAAKKMKVSKPAPVAKSAAPKAKSGQKRESVNKVVAAKKPAKAPAKTVRSAESSSKPVQSKPKVSAVKEPAAKPLSKSTASAKIVAKTTPPVASAPVKAKPPVKAAVVTPSKSAKGGKPAAVAAVPAPVGNVHETASTISTGGEDGTRTFSTIMQGHAAIAKGIEARKAAAKAKNLARFPRLAVPRTKPTKKLTAVQSKSYEQMLLRLRDELSRQMAFLRGASLTRSDEVNPEEDGSDAFERQLALKLASNEGDAIFEIDEALQRIKDGVYAICQDCGCIINSARLKALPFVRRCVECKRVAEKKRTADDRRYF